MAATTYTTVSGDTWDMIAYKCYGDDHAYEQIMDANPEYIDVFVFSGNTELVIPEQETDTQDYDSDYPAWRAALNG